MRTGKTGYTGASSFKSSAVAVAAAVPAELAGILALGGFRKAGMRGIKYYEGDVAGKRVALFVSGVGEARAHKTASIVCAEINPACYVSVGYSGALGPEMRHGDIVIGVAAMAAGGDVFASDAGLVTLAEAALSGPGIWFGPLACVGRVLVKSEEKRKLTLTPGPSPIKGEGSLGQPLAVDMETAGAARAAAESGVPFIALRAISDVLDEDLPVDFNRFTRGGEMDFARMLLHIILHPSVIPPLVRLGRNSRLGAKRLAGAVNRFLARMQ